MSRASVPAFQMVVSEAGTDLRLGSMEIDTGFVDLAIEQQEEMQKGGQRSLRSFLDKVVAASDVDDFSTRSIETMLSPCDNITLHDDARKLCSIPTKATHFCYCYPITKVAIWSVDCSTYCLCNSADSQAIPHISARKSA